MSLNVAEYIILPGLADPHVHPRDFAQSYKEDFETCTRAAIASGVDTIGAMPNYEPPEVRPYNLVNMVALHAKARGRLHCDVGMWAAAQPEYDNVGELEHVLPLSIGTKLYIEPTQGNDTQYAVEAFMPIASRHHEVAPDKLIAAHAEDDTIEDAIGYIAGDLGQKLYIPHVNNRFVLDAIRRAKTQDLPVFAEACPHHLFMTNQDIADLGWRARMKPQLGTQEDQDYLWAHLDDIDTIGTDHAPHTKLEKQRADYENPDGHGDKDATKCYGVPGLDAVLPLLLHEVIHGHNGNPRLTFNQLIQKTHTNPRRLMGLPTEAETAVTVDTGSYLFTAENVYSKVGWSPYTGREVTGKVVEVKRYGQPVFANGQFLSRRGRILHDAETQLYAGQYRGE